MSRRILLRAKSGPGVGIGHVMRSRSVAQEVLAAGGIPLLVVDDPEGVKLLEQEPYQVCCLAEMQGWASLPAAGAWVDGFVDWKDDLKQLRSNKTPVLLVENRSEARESCAQLVYPALHWTPDAWDAAHAERVLSGAPWIPLARDVRCMRPGSARDVDLLITFGGSDPARLTERVLGSLGDCALRTVVLVGPQMRERYPDLKVLTEGLLNVELLAPGTPIVPWIARSRMALTALGTTLYELAYLGVPALILANYASDGDALDWYGVHGPHIPLGVAGALSCEGLRARLRSGLIELETRGPVCIPELGSGAARLAELLLAGAA